MTLAPSPRESEEHASSLPEPLARLWIWPGVVWSLRQRGVVLGRLPEEGDVQLENRLGTALMALFRDERTEESFEALYAHARVGVAAWIASLLRRSADSLDPAELLQDTFVNVYRYSGGFRDEHPGSFRVWVRTIAGNALRRAHTRRGGACSFQDLPEGWREPADASRDPHEDASAGEEGDSLRTAWWIFLAFYGAAYRELGPRDRDALRMVEVEGRSYAEAGRLLSVSPSNMKMIIFRSRKRIAARMRALMLAGRSRSLRLAS